MIERDPRIDGHFNVKHRGLAGSDRKTIGSGGTLAIEQRMHDNRIGIRGRFLDPERFEQREFLAFGLAGVDREPPRRQSVNLALRNGAEVARAQKNAHLVVIVGSIDRRVNPETGESQIGVGRRRRVAAEGKNVGTIRNFAGLPVGDFVDVNARRVKEAAMKELHLEWQFITPPKCVFRQEANLPVMVVIEVLEIVRQLGIGRLVRFAGRIARQLPDD